MSIKPKIDFKGFKTYYRIVNPKGSKIPLLLLHGGPGSTHNYFEVLDRLAEIDDRPLVMYDQIGCGESMISGKAELFTPNTWLDELTHLREQLGLKRVHILGQSWGGMMAIWYALERQPQGVSSYILSSTLSSAQLWKQEQYRRISYMPEAMQKAIHNAVATDDYNSKEYQTALSEFMQRHCADEVLSDDAPECLRRPKIAGTEAYIVGWGPNEFTPTGTLSQYEFTDRLHEIQTPCLITNGQNDLCSPFIAKTMYDRLPNAEWELFAYSRHMPFVQENEKYIEVLQKWLNKQD